MATSLLPIGTSAATSDEFTVDDVFPTLIRKSAASTPAHDSIILVEIEDADGVWRATGVLDRSHPTHSVTGRGTYRLRRPAVAEGIGADIEE